MARTSKAKTERFEVRNRWTGAVQFTAEIPADPTASTYLKLGLAVRWAYENGASLDGASLDGARLDGALLDGARLDGASLVGASLDGARLDGASLVGASLDGARLGDQKIVRLIAQVRRLSDGNEALAFETESGEVWIKGGCKLLSLPDFRRRAESYDGAEKRAETLLILNYIEAQAKRLGVLDEPEGAPATRSPDPASIPERGQPAPVEPERPAGALSHATTEA